jgi:hypothetical protein
MEEARALIRRRVKLEFAPQRSADDILSLAFGWLTRNDESMRVKESRGQDEGDRDGHQTSSIQEVLR